MKKYKIGLWFMFMSFFFGNVSGIFICNWLMRIGL